MKGMRHWLGAGLGLFLVIVVLLGCAVPSTGANRAPTASCTVSPLFGTTETIFSFDASASSDPDGTIDDYAWDFDDGAVASGQTATHQYASEGTYHVRLTVTDADGFSDTEEVTIRVTSASSSETSIVFLHHSVGAALIEEGSVRETLTAAGYAFSDHGYNDDGLRGPDGVFTGTDFDVPGDNTDPDGFADIFSQPLNDPPDNTFSHLMQYDVIAFKSCYPTSNIGDDAQLAEYKSYYLSIRDRIDQYTQKIFIVVTPPPQVPANSDPSEGARARAFADWLQSDEYLSGHPNIFVFDLFDLLAASDDFLRAEYRVDDYDGHPNELANRTIGPLFVDFIDQAIRSYRAGGPPPAAPTTPPSEEVV
ncbi:MAG: PKD domain-containing protein, partial [Trueperaceae bacterium]